MPKDNSPSNPSPSPPPPPPPHHTVERMRYFIRPLNSTAKTWWLISWPKWSSPPRARRLASQTTYSWTVWIYLETIGTHAHIYYIYTHIYAITHTRTPVLELQGPVSRRRDLTPHRLSLSVVVVVGTLRFLLFTLLLCNIAITAAPSPASPKSPLLAIEFSHTCINI